MSKTAAVNNANNANANAEIAAFDALDLGPIKMKLMHVESGEGWSAARADAVEAEYRRFLFLMKKYPDAGASPTVDVDTFWHYHILDTMKYAVDCEAAFGYFLHHYPYVGIGAGVDAEDQVRAGETMRAIYAAEFGEAQGAASAWCTRAGASPAASAGQASAWCTRLGEAQDAAGSASAWCTRVGQDAAVAGQATAWCTRLGEAQGAARAETAWCTRASQAPAAAAQATAWCTRTRETPAAAAGQATAWCTRLGKLPAAIKAANAWCTVTNKTADTAELAQAA